MYHAESWIMSVVELSNLRQYSAAPYFMQGDIAYSSFPQFICECKSERIIVNAGTHSQKLS